jgi:hypothetical protein
MNNVVFRTGGDWDSTTLHNNGQEVNAAQMFVELHAGERGIAEGGQITAIVRPQDNPQQEFGLFPGRLEMDFPRHNVVIENMHPGFAFEFTRVWFDGQDVTNHIMEIYVDINAVDNIVNAHLTLYRAHWFSSDEVATYNLL